MEIEEPVLHGLLLFPPHGILGPLKESWPKKYCQLFKASKYGIERLEIYDSRGDFLSQEFLPRIITLEACVKIGPSNQTRVFSIVTKSGAYHFGCLSETETRNWINHFRQVAFKNHTSCQTIEEDNDLYSTSGEGVFSVKLVETEASKKCGLEEKEYTLLVTEVDMKLMENNSVLFIWPYTFIRKYGYRDGKFTFEAGRKCESGEGSFRLEHSNQQEIFRCISLKMKSMKKLLSGESSAYTTRIDFNDAQYYAALSMEPGSRSPLPPTPTINSVNLIDDESSTSSLDSHKPLTFSNSNFSLHSLPFIKSLPPIIKPKPTKPPRKYALTGLTDKKFEPGYSELSGCGKFRKLDSYASIDSFRQDTDVTSQDEDERHPYDLVEVRNNAWKTLGIDTIIHTERKDGPPPCLLERKAEFIDPDLRIMKPACENAHIDGNEQGKSKSNEDFNEPVNTDGKQGIIDNDNNDDDLGPKYERIISQSTTQDYNTITASPIIHHNLLKSHSTENYDKLQHFGSLYKLNSKPAYKTLQTTVSLLTGDHLLSTPDSPIILLESSNPSWNDYELVDGISDMRLTEDNNRTYGLIRKKSSSPALQHCEYATVSKPKRI